MRRCRASIVAVPFGRPGRWRVDSGSVWEADGRLQPGGAHRRSHPGQRHHRHPRPPADWCLPGDAAAQAAFILDKIAASLAAFGASLDDVVRTRIYLVNADHWEPVSRVHGRRFGDVRPANTLLQVGRLIGDYLVEIEAEAVVGTGAAAPSLREAAL